MTLPGSGYGRELFSTFVPPSARARLDARTAGKKDTALLSGALVARHAGALAGVVVEVTWAGRAALAGTLRAARHEDAIVAVSVPAFARSAEPQAPRAIVDDILRAADAALFDRPLVIVARAMPLAPGASVERLSEGLYRDLEAGFTSVGFSPAAFQGDVDELVRVTAPLVEQDLGLELEMDAGAGAGADAALVLARVDDAGLSLSAVRGANAGDEMAGALLVVDVAQATGSLAPTAATAAGVPMRVVIDGAMGSVLRVLERGGDDERVEAAAYMAAADALVQLGVKGTATRLLDALAASMR
jgi:hypothetical protein